MPTFDEIFSVLKEFLPLITAGGVAALAAGLIPRISPGRAVWIALRSRFAFKPVPESIRFEEAKLLKSRLADKDFGQGYLVVIGEKGVGKSCLLSTVTSKMPGVITVEAQPSDNENTIIKNTLQQLTNPLFKSMNPLEMAPRVIFWYRFFTLGRSPIVIINAAERRKNVKTDLQDGQDAREAIGTHLCAEISAAIKLVMDAQDMDEIIKLLDKDSNIIPSHLLKDKKLKDPFGQDLS
ncbi:hypothetical protein BDV3_002287 [Batrachochytrium dendrobatidis]